MEIKRNSSDLIRSNESTTTEKPQEQNVSTASAVQEEITQKSPITIAARKNEFAFAGVTQQALLGAQLDSTDRTGQNPIGAGAKLRELKPGDQGNDVLRFKIDLNQWLRANGLETLDVVAPYDAKTAEAVAKFQKATGLPENGRASDVVQDRLNLEMNPTFQNMNGDVKDIIRSDFNILQKDPAGRANLMKLATDRQFSYLISPESQKSALNALMNNAADSEHFKNVQDTVLDVAILEKEKSLDHLPDETKKKVIDTLFYKTEDWQGNWGQLTSETRKNIVSLAKDPEFARLKPDQQTQMLDSITVNANPNTSRTMKDILNSPGFQNGTDAIKNRILDLANENATYDFYHSDPPADRNRELEKLLSVIGKPEFSNLSEDDQNIQLNQFRRSGSPNAIG